MRSGWGRLGAVLIVALLLAPVAQAAASAGDFITQGAATFNAVSGAAYEASAFFLPDSSRVSFLAINATSAHVCHYEWDSKEIQIDPVSGNPLFTNRMNVKQRCFDSPAQVGLIPGDQTGWAGGRIDPPGSVDFSGDGSTHVEPSAYSVLATPGANGGSTDGTRDQPDTPNFVETTTGPHLNASEPGTLRYHGHMAFKFMGFDVAIQTPANRTEIETGDSAASGPVHDRVRAWVTIDFDGDLVLASDAPFLIEASQASLSWDGAAAFVTDSGRLTLGGTTYDAQQGGAASVDGRFSGTVAPSGSQGDALHLSLSGDARSVAVGSARIAPGPVGARFPWAAGVGVAVASVVVLGGAAAALRRHARPRRVREAEGLAREAARLAEEGGMAREALALYGAAIRRAPSAAYFLASGHLWRGLGEPRRALRCFVRAAKTGRGGAAEYGAALVAFDLGEPEAAASWMLRALGRGDLEASLLSVFATDAAFAGLREREPVRIALEAARQRQESHGWPCLR